MIELIKSEAKHNAEFREEVRKEFSEMRKNIAKLQSAKSNADGKIYVLVIIISGAVQVAAKVFLG